MIKTGTSGSPDQHVYLGGYAPRPQVGAVLNDEELRAWAQKHVTPYTPAQVNPASYDLCLGELMRKPMWYWESPIPFLKRYMWRKYQQDPERWPLWGPEVLSSTQNSGQ